jgi:hypothetical protein
MAKLKANTAKKPHRMDLVVRAAFAGVIRELRLKLNAALATKGGQRLRSYGLSGFLL